MNRTQKMLIIAVLAVIIGFMILLGVVLLGHISLPKVLDGLPFYDRQPVPALQDEPENESQPKDEAAADGRTMANGITNFDSSIVCLDLRDLFCELNVTTGSSDLLSVECQGLKQNLRAEATDGTLRLSGPSNQQLSDITDLNKLFELLQKGVGMVNITLPRDWNGDIIIHSFAGELNVNGATCRSLQADIYAGDLELNVFHADDLQLKINAGELSLDQVQLTTAQLEMNVGSIDMEQLHAEQTTVRVDTGDVEFDALDVSSLQAHVSVGSVEGSLYGTPADYTITASTDVGECNLPTSGLGPRSLDIKAGVGSIDIDFD